jgi:hypothetical protein
LEAGYHCFFLNKNFLLKQNFYFLGEAAKDLRHEKEEGPERADVTHHGLHLLLQRNSDKNQS